MCVASVLKQGSQRSRYLHEDGRGRCGILHNGICRNLYSSQSCTGLRLLSKRNVLESAGQEVRVDFIL
jgi:hypothetical protein